MVVFGSGSTNGCRGCDVGSTNRRHKPPEVDFWQVVGVRYAARCSLLRDCASERMTTDNLPTFVVRRYALLGVVCNGRRLSGVLDQLVTLMVVASNQVQDYVTDRVGSTEQEVHAP